MATHNELAFEWSMLCEECTDCWSEGDLQLAAELGKTLLERNKDLESNLKHHQVVIEDQTQEIEYLTKQTAALREVNDSRLKIYEQLELSIQDLEKTNSKLGAENDHDKKKIKGMYVSIETLEGKCEELQRCLDEQRAMERQRWRKERKKSQLCDDANLRRVLSMENGLYQYYDDSEVFSVQTDLKTQIRSNREKWSRQMEAADLAEGENPFEEELMLLHEQVQKLQMQKGQEQQRREELEIEVTFLIQENTALQEQMTQLRQKEDQVKSLAEEMATFEEVSHGRLCRRCLGSLQDEKERTPFLDLTDPVEDEGTSLQPTHGECALVKLKNGGYAWGSQESLASVGHVIDRRRSTDSETGWPESNKDSLLNELDTQYRILIEKYEALLNVQRNSNGKYAASIKDSPFRNIDPEKNEKLNCLSLQEELMMSNTLGNENAEAFSGPISILFTKAGDDGKHAEIAEDFETNTGLLQDANRKEMQKNNNPTSGQVKVDVLTESTVPLVEFSEAETSSSGFSEGDVRFMNRETQTDILAASSSDGTLNNPRGVEGHFKSTPEYKKLFQEIFTVLKKSINYDENGDVSTTELTPHNLNKLNAHASKIFQQSDKTSKKKEGNTDDNLPSMVEMIHAELNASTGSTENICKDKEAGEEEDSASCSSGMQEQGKGGRVKQGKKRGAKQRGPRSLTSRQPKSSGEEPCTFKEKLHVREMVEKSQEWQFRPSSSSASASVAKLKRLEKTYAEVLKQGTGNANKQGHSKK